MKIHIKQRVKNRIVKFLKAIYMVEYDWEEINWDNLDEVKAYFRDTIAEGYPAEEEIEALNKLFSDYKNLQEEVEDLRTIKENLEKIFVEQAYEDVNY